MKWFPGVCAFICSAPPRMTAATQRRRGSLSWCPRRLHATFGGAPLRRNRTPARAFCICSRAKVVWMRPRAQIMDVQAKPLCKWVDNCRMQICVYVRRWRARECEPYAKRRVALSDVCKCALMPVLAPADGTARWEKWNCDPWWSAHTLPCNAAENYNAIV